MLTLGQSKLPRCCVLRSFCTHSPSLGLARLASPQAKLQQPSDTHTSLAGQVLTYVTRPQSTALRDTTQLRLPPRFRRVCIWLLSNRSMCQNTACQMTNHATTPEWCTVTCHHVFAVLTVSINRQINAHVEPRALRARHGKSFHAPGRHLWPKQTTATSIRLSHRPDSGPCTAASAYRPLKCAHVAHHVFALDLRSLLAASTRVLEVQVHGKAALRKDRLRMLSA